jgi:hypothetical protein
MAQREHGSETAIQKQKKGKKDLHRDIKNKNYYFCAIVLYLVVYHVCFQDGKLCLLVANDKLDGK